MRWLTTVLAVATALAGTAPASGSDDRTAQLRELRHQQHRWAQARIRDYRFRLRLRCFCPAARHPYTITVRGGRPHGATGYARRLDTVPEMFAAIRRGLRDDKAG